MVNVPPMAPRTIGGTMSPSCPYTLSATTQDANSRSSNISHCWVELSSLVCPTLKYTGRQKGKRESDTDRQTNRQRDRDTDRNREKDTVTDRQTHTDKLSHRF